MINLIDDKLFWIDTKNTTYCFYVNEIKYLEHLYYGKKVSYTKDSLESLKQKQEFAAGNGLVYDQEHLNMTLESKLLEYSSRGKGDIRNPLIEIEYEDGTTTSDFVFSSYEITKHQVMKDLPTSYGKDNEVKDLVITLDEKKHKVEVKLIYSVYEDKDIITRRMEIVNKTKNNIIIKRALSLQLDMVNEEYEFTSFHGNWIREMKRYDQPCVIGTITSESLAGVSSSRSNPFVMLHQHSANETYGKCYAFNLIYSGNHAETVEVDGFNNLRFMTGINPTTFSYELKNNEVFETPEAVMTFSDSGYQNISHNLHDFINENIVRGVWKDLPRPVLNNSWEAAYFKFNEAKIISMAKAAAKAGIELFVLDDGWFGTRNDDTQGLGDWKENKKKLPKGLKGLSSKIHHMGMKFGIWVEPEMVNRNSELYRKHQDWAVEIPSQDQSLGRNQLFLDLTNSEVVDYLYEQMEYVFSEGNVDYVKWDMNRIMSDYYSKTLNNKRMLEFNHRYVKGLYCLLDRLVKKFPNILFESCASGGNRFDLGMLCYMPQTWASDNSDAISRTYIQNGYSFSYPMTTIGAHVSACPNHQTLRNTTIDTRFNVAFCGELGYEFNFNEISKEDYQKAVNQISIYKEYRQYLFKGDYYRLIDNDNAHAWMVVSKDKKHAVLVYVLERPKAGTMFDQIKLTGLDDKLTYHIHSEKNVHHIKDFGGLVNAIAPIHIKQDGLLHKLLGLFIKMNGDEENLTVKGDLLNSAGLIMKQLFVGTGFNDNTRLMLDNDSRLYYFDALDEK